MSLIFDMLQSFFSSQAFLLQAGKPDLQKPALLILKVCIEHAEFFPYYPQNNNSLEVKH